MKKFFILLAFLAVCPLVLLTWLEAAIFGKKQEKLYNASYELLSLAPSIIGVYMRKAFYWAVCTNVSSETHFLIGSWLAHRNNIIGPGVIIGAYTFIGYAEIGRDVIMGARVSIISGKYQHGRPDQRAGGKPIVEENKVIHIGDNSWIGQDAVILANIGSNCTIGAGSVVLRDVPDNTTVLGNPARKVNL